MPTSQRAGIKKPRYVVIPRRELVDEPFILPDVDFCSNTLYFFDEGHSADVEVGWPLKEIVRLPKNVVRRRIWCLPCRNYEKHVVINDIAIPESLWEDFGITIKKLIPKED